MNAAVKIGVIGVGHLGFHHARIYSQLAKESEGQLKFVGCCDSDPEKLQAVTGKLSCPGFTLLDEIAQEANAVSISTPTETHFSIASEFLSCGKHVLVEKPITKNVDDAAKLIQLARDKGCVLQVGHVERFNPVMNYLNEILTEARFIEVHRLSPYPGRSTDIGVILDLMIHDIDIVLALVKSPIESLNAVGIPVLSSSEDIANARIRFANGCVANLTASRVSPERMRKIRIFGRTTEAAAYISLDYMKQEGEIYRVANADAAESSFFKKILSGKRGTITSEFAGKKIMREPVPIERDEPLKLELQHFLESVRLRQQPLVTGESAKQTLEIALELTRQVSLD